VLEFSGQRDRLSWPWRQCCNRKARCSSDVDAAARSAISQNATRGAHVESDHLHASIGWKFNNSFPH